MNRETEPLDMGHLKSTSPKEELPEAHLLGQRAEVSCCINDKVTSVITTCTSRKHAKPMGASTPLSLSLAPQAEVEKAWLKRLYELPTRQPAEQLYAGRGFGISRSVANSVGAGLYVVSAGLGLVAANHRVPAYGLTVSHGHSESIGARVQGRFDPAHWFSAMLKGPHSVRWSDTFAGGTGRVLIALTRPYAEMIGGSLKDLDPNLRARLRIFGASLSAFLPEEVHCSLMPYDERLDAIVPGTRADFSQRALNHFVRIVACSAGSQDSKADAEAVRHALAAVATPRRVRRLRQTDEEILQLIREHLRSQSRDGSLLRVLRDRHGVACEQSRFRRLYRTAVGEGALT